MSDTDDNLRLPEEDEQFAKVITMLGANRVTVVGADGTERTARIPGKMQKKVWIREDDIILIEPWDWQDEKADIKYRYTEQEVKTLKENDILAESMTTRRD